MDASPKLPVALDRAALNDALALCVLGLAIAPLYGTIDPNDPAFAAWDLHAYRTMARSAPGLARDVAQPFAFRVLGPWLAGVMGLPVEAAFRVLATALSAPLAGWLYLVLRVDGIRRDTAVFTAALLPLNRHFFGFTAWDVYQVADLVALNALGAFFVASRLRRTASMAVATAIGVLGKESAVLAALAWAFFETRDARPGDRVRAIAPAAAGLVLLAGLRFCVPHAGGPSLVEALALNASKAASPWTVVRTFLGVLVPLSPILIVEAGSVRTYLASRPRDALFLALVIASTLFGSNVERLVSPAYLVLYGALAFVIDARSTPRPARVAYALFAVLGALHHRIGRFEFPSPGQTLALTVTATVGVSVVALAVRMNARAATAHPGVETP